MSTTILTDEQKAQFVTEITDYGTGFVSPLFAVVDAIEQAVLQSPEIQALKKDAKDDFIDGVLLGLQVITGAGNAGSAEHDELMRSAGVDLVVRRAIKQEMWELAGLDRNQISITARRSIEEEGNKCS